MKNKGIHFSAVESSYGTDLMQRRACNKCTCVCEGEHSRVQGEVLACARGITQLCK